MSTQKDPHAIGASHSSSDPWLQRLGVFALVASGLSIVGMLALHQTTRRSAPTPPQSVAATIQFQLRSSNSGAKPSLESWRADILSRTNLHAAIVELGLNQGLLPRAEKTVSITDWEVKVIEQLRIESVRDRRHSDDSIRITYPVGRNVSQAVALVNALAQRAVISREASVRQAAEQATQSLLALRAATVAAADRLKAVQADLEAFKKTATAQAADNKSSVSVDSFFADRRAQLARDLAEYQRRRDVLLETLLPAHPEIRDLDVKIDTVQSALAQVPPSANPADAVPAAPTGTSATQPNNNDKWRDAVAAATTDWQRLAAEESAAEQQIESSRVLPSFVVTLAQIPVVQATGEKSSPAMMAFVVLAAIAIGIAAAGWVRNEPVVLKSAREVEKLLHLKVLAVLPSAGVKI